MQGLPAAILVLVFAQQIEDVIRLTWDWDDVTVTHELATVVALLTATSAAAARVVRP